MSRPLEGQRGVITGAASGIGAGLAGAFADAGAQLVLMDRAETVSETAAGLGAAGVSCDVAVPADVERAFASAHEQLGRIDFLVNNAGIRLIKDFVDVTLEDWQQVIDINLTGTFLCTQAAVRLMLDQEEEPAPTGGGRGRILNIGSNSGTLALTQRAAYVTSKAGVHGFTRAIAMELAGQGIVCNAIAPGLIETPLSAPYFEDPAMVEMIRREMPIGRWGQVSEMAGAAIFLCSPAAGYIHGQTLHVDGGWTAGKGY